MDCIAIKIDPAQLTNPDADIRYALPDLLVKRSGGVIQDDGYDYIGPSNLLVVYLRVSDLEKARACVIDVIANVPVMENNLRQAATAAVQRGGKYETIYPAESREDFVV